MSSLTSDRAFYQVPKHHKQWTKSAKALCLSRASINTKDGLKPGSEVVQGQHLLYKVYWPRLIAPARVDVRKMGFENEFGAASEWMSEYGPFQAYLTSLEAGSAITAHSDYDDHDLGIFEVARSQQLQLLHADGARDADQDTVNSGLMSLLAALTIKHQPPIGEWMVQRLRLTATFRKAGFTTRIDGYLRSHRDRQVEMLVEVKARARRFEEPDVSMQETSEIIAWLKTTGLERASNRPILLSQNDRDIYLSTISFTPEYRRYLDGTQDSLRNNQFMAIQRHGPWRIWHAAEMEHLGAIILGITLKHGA